MRKRGTSTLELWQIKFSNEEMFNAVIMNLSAIENETQRVALANEIFGDNIATVLIPLLSAGGSALNDLSKEFEAVGFLSNAQVEKLAAFDDKLNILKTRISLVKTELGIAFLPILERLGVFLTESIIPAVERLTDWFSNLSTGTQNLIFTVLLLTAALAPVLLIAGKIFTVGGSLISAIPMLSKVIVAMGTATGRSLVGLTALATSLLLIFSIVENWGNMGAVAKIIFSFRIINGGALVLLLLLLRFYAWRLVWRSQALLQALLQ